MPSGIKGMRWIETGKKVWQLEDEPRHFNGCVSDWGSHCTWYVGMYWQGEAKTKREAMGEVEKIIIPIHRYCLATTFGDNEYAVFEVVNGQAVNRASGTAKHCKRYVMPGRLIVNVKRYRKA